MQRLLTCVAAASLALGGIALVTGCQHDKDKTRSDTGYGGTGTSSNRGDMNSDAARTAGGGTYDATGQNMGQNPPGTYGPGQTGSAGSSGRYGPGTAAPNQNTGGYGNYGGVGPGSGYDATGRGTNTGNTSGSAGSSSGGTSGGSAGSGAGGGGR